MQQGYLKTHARQRLPPGPFFLLPACVLGLLGVLISSIYFIGLASNPIFLHAHRSEPRSTQLRPMQAIPTLRQPILGEGTTAGAPVAEAGAFVLIICSRYQDKCLRPERRSGVMNHVVPV